jgi:hypothetical protein
MGTRAGLSICTLAVTRVSPIPLHLRWYGITCKLFAYKGRLLCCNVTWCNHIQMPKSLHSLARSVSRSLSAPPPPRYLSLSENGPQKQLHTFYDQLLMSIGSWNNIPGPPSSRPNPLVDSCSPVTCTHMHPRSYSPPATIPVSPHASRNSTLKHSKIVI